MNNVAISELLLLVLLVLLPAAALFDFVNKISFLPRVPIIPAPLRLDGFSQEGNKVCLYFGGEVSERNIFLILEGKETVPIEVTIKGGKACFELNTVSGYYYIHSERGTLGKIYVFNPADVILSHGLVFGGEDPDRYEGILFHGDHNDVYATVPSDKIFAIEAPCLRKVTCEGSCTTETTSYGTCTITFYVGSSLVGTKEVSIYQYEECASSAECKADINRLSTDFYTVLLVKPKSGEGIALRTTTPKDFNWRLVADFNGTYFRVENTSPAVSVSLQNTVVRNVFLGNSSSTFVVSNDFPDDYNPLRVVIEDSNPWRFTQSLRHSRSRALQYRNNSSLYTPTPVFVFSARKKYRY